MKGRLQVGQESFYVKKVNNLDKISFRSVPRGGVNVPDGSMLRY